MKDIPQLLETMDKIAGKLPISQTDLKLLIQRFCSYSNCSKTSRVPEPFSLKIKVSLNKSSKECNPF